MKSSWTEIVYDIYSFLYREPHHLGKIKNPISKYDTYEKSMSHLKKMEVTMNHIANIFFSFLPSKQLHKLFTDTLQKSLEYDEYDIFVRYLENAVQGIGDLTQPDIFFVGEKNVISIEMKVGDTSSLEQVMKYAFLHYKEQETSNKAKKHHLIYLAQDGFSSVREERFTDENAVKEAFRSFEIPEFSKKGKIQLGTYREHIRHMVENMNISFLSYTELKGFCKEILPSFQDNRQIEKLLNGMIQEIDERRLR